MDTDWIDFTVIQNSTWERDAGSVCLFILGNSCQIYFPKSTVLLGTSIKTVQELFKTTLRITLYFLSSYKTSTPFCTQGQWCTDTEISITWPISYVVEGRMRQKCPLQYELSLYACSCRECFKNTSIRCRKCQSNWRMSWKSRDVTAS